MIIAVGLRTMAGVSVSKLHRPWAKSVDAEAFHDLSSKFERLTIAANNNIITNKMTTALNKLGHRYFWIGGYAVSIFGVYWDILVYGFGILAISKANKSRTST